MRIPQGPPPSPRARRMNIEDPNSAFWKAAVLFATVYRMAGNDGPEIARKLRHDLEEALSDRKQPRLVGWSEGEGPPVDLITNAQGFRIVFDLEGTPRGHEVCALRHAIGLIAERIATMTEEEFRRGADLVPTLDNLNVAFVD